MCSSIYFLIENSNLKRFYSLIFSAPFTCEYEGKRYRSLDKFTSGVNGCAQCLCIDGRVDCDESKCKILIDPPEASTEPVIIQPKLHSNHPFPPAPPFVPTTTTTTTTTRAPVIRTGSQGYEKGPDLGYYAHHLTNVNMNTDKGPPDTMPYMPEPYQYLQAQVGSRGPPGNNNQNSQTRKYCHVHQFYTTVISNILSF